MLEVKQINNILNNFLFFILFNFILAECPEYFIEGSQSTGDETICLPELFNHNISTQQAGYIFLEVDIEGVSVDNEDWVAAFNGDVCVLSLIHI